jgi:uncharacterized protein (UPF0333 family)
MGISVIGVIAPASPLKSVQRGLAASAGNITITAVNPAKTIINSFSTSSAGTVAATGSVTGTLTPSGGNVSGQSAAVSGNGGNQTGSFATYPVDLSISGGSTNLTTAQYGAYLVDATTIAVTGPCRYEVIEFN